MWLHTQPPPGCGESSPYNDGGHGTPRRCGRGSVPGRPLPNGEAAPLGRGRAGVFGAKGEHLCYGVWLLIFCVCAYEWVRVGAGCPWAQNANDNRLYDAGGRKKFPSFYCGGPAQGSSPSPMPRGVHLYTTETTNALRGTAQKTSPGTAQIFSLLKTGNNRKSEIFKKSPDTKSENAQPKTCTLPFRLTKRPQSLHPNTRHLLLNQIHSSQLQNQPTTTRSYRTNPVSRSTSVG